VGIQTHVIGEGEYVYRDDFAFFFFKYHSFCSFGSSFVLAAIDELRNLKDSLRIGDERDDVVDMAVVFYEVCLIFLHIVSVLINQSRFLHRLSF